MKDNLDKKYLITLEEEYGFDARNVLKEDKEMILIRLTEIIKSRKPRAFGYLITFLMGIAVGVMILI